jgi:alkanesulfonate monooxygenase SsuD/methylene tetrahydromethanopterin reductase-like flavin-dependent oxidoreductase (luciferase family)
VPRRFGILSFPSAPIDQMSQRWQMAEELGFDSAWVADTLTLPGLVDYEAWTTLAGLVDKVSRLRVGTLVTQITFRHPAMLAAQAITLDHLSGGRLELGIGAGDYAADSAAVGEEPWAVDERLARFEEQLSILDPLLRGQPVDYQGRFYRSTLQLAPPLQRPRLPLVVAGQVRRSLQLAARFGDGWNTLGGQTLTKSGRPPLPLPEAAARTREQGRILDEYCRDLGRDPKTIRRSVLPYRVQTDPLSSLDAFDEFVGHYAGAGIDEFIFYWPPVENLKRKEAVSGSQQAQLERIGAERLRRRGD